MATDFEKVAELTAIIQAVKDRVRLSHPQPGPASGADGTPPIHISVADLLPIVHARDAAQAKIAAIGSVNPRAGGLSNKLIQAVKRMIARALGWFVRDQVTFNRETIATVEAILEALNDHNRILVSLAAQTGENIRGVSGSVAHVAQELGEKIDLRFYELGERFQPYIDQLGLLKSEAQQLQDMRKHWIEWRAEWERKLSLNESHFLRSVAEQQGAFQHRVGQMETNFREIAKLQHNDYLAALERANADIQKRFWADLEKIRTEYERLIHTELRVLRLRGFGSGSSPDQTPDQSPFAASPALAGLTFDYGRFAERFRGSEEYVRRNQEFYRPIFAGRGNVLDIGCGRGEFLEVMREAGVPARGIDLGAESVAQCRAKGLQAEEADLFPYLSGLPDGEFDGIFSAQVVEHIAPERLPEMIRLCGAKLRRGGILTLETPNPECLAIFATHFFLDPTHTRPVPHPLASFYMEEAGLGLIEVHKLYPALDSMPELASLPDDFRGRFFGGLDYAITGRRL